MGKNDNKPIDTEATRNGAEKNPGSEAASKRRGRGRPRKEDGPIVGRNETEADVPRLVLVDVPEIDEEILDKPKKENNGNSSTNKKKRKDVQFELKKEQTAVLIKTVFDIAGSREGMELWKLSKQEAELIAEPLNTLLNKNPFVDNITSKYGDYIALAVALLTVIVPRLYVHLATKPKEKKEKKISYDSKSIKSPSESIPGSNQQGGTNGNSGERINRESSVTSPTISAELYQFIPAIQ